MYDYSIVLQLLRESYVSNKRNGDKAFAMFTESSPTDISKILRTPYRYNYSWQEPLGIRLTHCVVRISLIYNAIESIWNIREKISNEKPKNYRKTRVKVL